MTDLGEQNIISDVESVDLATSSSEPTDNISKILKYKEEGYVFHGSSNPAITILEPRKANDVTDEDFNTDTAVYASPNPQVCIMGVVKPEGVSGTWKAGCYEKDLLVAEIPKSWKQLVEKGIGTLYVLPRESFSTDKPNNWQVKSHTSVKPIDKIPVTFNDFIALGGEVIWTEE